MCGLLLFARTIDHGLNHDEHQFLAPGALLSREGLLPYRDFPLFHFPNLVFVYATLDRLTGEPILGPKLFSFACTWLTLGIILVVSLRRARGGTGGYVLTLLALCAFFLFDPLILYTAGKTWNHELPSFLLVLAVCCHVAALNRDSRAYITLSGIACGLAIGTRLTFLPCLLPLFALIFSFPVDAPRRRAMAIAFSVGATVALAPSIYFLVTTPGAFIFDNFEFPRLRLLDPENTRIQKTSAIWRKLRYLAKEVVLPGWPIFAAFVAVLIRDTRQRLGAADPDRTGVLVVCWTALFLVIGCFLPSRYQYQHFFALMPLLLLGIALTGVDAEGKRPIWHIFPLFLAILATVVTFRANDVAAKEKGAFPKWNEVTRREEWLSSKAAVFGAELRQLVPRGRILTLAPAWPIAGGLRIYPEFATGPFAWRSARYVPEQRRAEYHFVGPDDLDTFLTPEPPGGILTGVEDDNLEAPLIDYARHNGFLPVPMSGKRILWLRNARSTP